MADFAINPVTVTPTETFKLGDMLNLARGAQAYRQTEQMNPLQVQQQQAVTNSAQLENMLKHQQNSTRNLLKLLNQEEAITPTEIENHVVSTMKNAGATPQAIAQATQNLPKSGTDKELRAFVAKHATNSLSAEAQLDKLFPQAQMLNTGAQQIPVQMGNQALTGIQPGTKVGPATANEMAPGVIEVNGVKYKLDAKTQNLVPISSAVPIPTENVAPSVPSVSNVQQVKPMVSGLVKQDMPVAVGGIPQMNTQQVQRYEEGQKIQAESTGLAQAAQEAKQTSRKIKENIAAAAGSAPGQALRASGKWLAGNEQLDELVKNLADNQMRQSVLMGASTATDQARQVVALANGSENITPQALAQIVQRADATSTALEKFNSGLNKYFEKAGTYNGPIHARNFKQTWSENYDPRIFMVQNINSSDMSNAEKQIQLQAVLKGTTEEERRTLAKKAETIKRLEKGDF